MNKYTAVIMDYASGSLRFYHFNNMPDDPYQWIIEHDKHWSDSTCFWMGVYSNTVEEEHVYE